jgi:hypothetical protein
MELERPIITRLRSLHGGSGCLPSDITSWSLNLRSRAPRPATFGLLPRVLIHAALQHSEYRPESSRVKH